MRRRAAIAAVAFASGAVIGAPLAIATYAFLDSRDTSTWLALALAGMAFFAGYLILAWVLRIVLVVVYWRKTRRRLDAEQKASSPVDPSEGPR